MLVKEPSPCFGVNLALEYAATINENDSVYVTRLSQM